MPIDQKEAAALAEEIARTMGIKTCKNKRILKLVTKDYGQNKMSALQRDVLYGRIRDLGNLFSLNWLIRQETIQVCGILESLTDCQLTDLLSKMERARECREEGIAFSDVPGMVKDCSTFYSDPP